MSGGVLGPQQLRSIIEEKWKKDLDALAAGVHVSASWTGPKEVDFEFGSARVVHADTVFKAREELSRCEKNQERIILLTGLHQHDLGLDVVARLARRRLFSIDHWAVLCSLFKAKEPERSICDHAIARALLEHAPSDGYPPVSAGILDAGTVWRAVCRHVFDMGDREPDLVSLLLWAISANSFERYQAASEEIRVKLRERLIMNIGEVADTVLRFVENGAGKDALALSAACQVVFGKDDAETLAAAAARMEQFHGKKPVPKAVGRELGKAAIEAIAELDRHDDPRIVQEHPRRADLLLKHLVCEDYAYRNNLTRLSFEQRLSLLGVAIQRAVDLKTDEAFAECEHRLEEIRDHRLAKLDPRMERVLRAESAVRLTRRLKQEDPIFTSFSDKCKYYIRDISFIDFARESLHRGDESTELSEAYALLDEAVSRRREEWNRGFAGSLSDWTESGSTSADVIGVEDVLGGIVAKVAKNARVLLVVMDGMSWGVCRELLEDIRRYHWVEVSLVESGEPPPAVIATIPSVTHYSRASLLSGFLTEGDQSVEARNFQTNAALNAVCDKRYPPEIFHKKDVTDGARGVVSDDLAAKLLSQNHRIVGVVINAIDDRLNNAHQVIDHWCVDRISPLGTLMSLAGDAGRVVILVGDHGHIWHRPDARYRPHEGDNRRRDDDGSIAEDEIVLTGERVLSSSNQKSIIVPWSEKVYYRRQQNGYHGGATPQEMICPLVVLSDKVGGNHGLYGCESSKPEWWSKAPKASAKIERPRSATTAPIRKRAATLFDLSTDRAIDSDSRTKNEPTETSLDWIDRLFKSPAYKSQKERARRHTPEDKLMRKCLSVLAEGGGATTPAAFAKAAEIPPARLDGLIAKMRRVLNIDGYDIITMDRNENRLEVNVELLKRQFDLE